MQVIKPQLKVLDLAMIIVSLVIGVGIFRTPAMVAAAAGVPALFFAAWILGGVVSLFGALTFAEIGARHPVAGGFYQIFSVCYHPAYAFMLNWVLLLTMGAGMAGVAILGVEYLAPVAFPGAWQDSESIRLGAFATLVALAILNFAGIRTGSRTQNFLSGLKIFMVLLLIMALFGAEPLPLEEYAVAGDGNGNWISALGVALISVFYTYGGYQQTINFGADIRDPERNLPRAIFLGIALIILLYFGINLAYFQVLGLKGMVEQKLVAGALARVLFGEYGWAVISVIIYGSVLGFINATMLSTPRWYFAMARDKVLPGIFMKVNAKTQVQEFALGFFVVVSLASLFLLGTFEKIVNYVMVIDSIALASAAASLFILRKGSKPDYQGFKVPGYPWVPGLFVVFLAMVSVNVCLSDPEAALVGLGMFLAGYPLFWLLRRVMGVEKNEDR